MFEEGTQPMMAYAGLYNHDTSDLYLATYRAYDPATARWLNRDPIRETGGLNLYAYVGGNPTNMIDPNGLETTVTVWEPVGWGSSSFGHISTSINGTTYTFNPSGMSVLPTSDYLSLNDFRSGVGANLKISSDQELQLQSCMSRKQPSYNVLKNNCGTPIQGCLKEIGYDVGGKLLPISIGNSLFDAGLVSGVEFYQQTASSKGSSAPWTK